MVVMRKRTQRFCSPRALSGRQGPRRFLTHRLLSWLAGPGDTPPNEMPNKELFVSVVLLTPDEVARIRGGDLTHPCEGPHAIQRLTDDATPPWRARGSAKCTYTAVRGS